MIADLYKKDGTTTTRTFVHTPSIIEAEEAEEIGVEHLLRDIRNVAVGTLSSRITSQLQSLQGLHVRLQDIGKYLQRVLNGELPVNHAILGNLQDVFNLLPNLTPPKGTTSLRLNNSTQVDSNVVSTNNSSELARAMSIKTNDQLMSIYLSSLIRAITAFHDLIENKLQNKQQAEDRDSKADDAKITKEEKLMNDEVGITKENTSINKKDDKKEGEEERDQSGKK